MENPFSNVPPVEVTIKGTGNGMPLLDGQVIKTPDHQPDLIIKIAQPIRSLLVGFVADFLKAWAGLIGAAMTPLGGKLLYASDFWHMLFTCASLAVAGPAFSLITNVSTIFSALKEKYPLVVNMLGGKE